MDDIDLGNIDFILHNLQSKFDSVFKFLTQSLLQPQILANSTQYKSLSCVIKVLFSFPLKRKIYFMTCSVCYRKPVFTRLTFPFIIQDIFLLFVVVAIVVVYIKMFIYSLD